MCKTQLTSYILIFKIILNNYGKLILSYGYTYNLVDTLQRILNSIYISRMTAPVAYTARFSKTFMPIPVFVYITIYPN